MITVPCCEKCRKEQSKDDEYFRLAIVSSSNVSERESAKQVLESIHRSLRKPGKLGFARLINESLFETEVHTNAGIYLGKAGGIQIKKKRIDRVAERIIRGLFYHEFGHPLPQNYQVTNQFSQTGFLNVAKIMKEVRFPEPREIGRVFWYTFAMTKEDPYSGVWLQVYYEGLQFLGFTVNPDRERFLGK